MKQFPDKFTVTITEEDRKKADTFLSGNCLLDHAVRRRLRTKEVRCGASIHRVGDHCYRSEGSGSVELKYDALKRRKPFYDKSVVGTKVKFWKA